MKAIVLPALVAGALLAAAAPAAAHVTLNPREAEAGAFVKFDVRVPNERDDANTTKVEIQLPPGFDTLSYQPVAGWTTKVVGSEPVRRVSWTATGSGVKPGQFVEFPISVQVPEEATGALTFKALQTYSGGEVVRWIGDEGSDSPAPAVEVLAAPEGAEEGHGGAAAPAEEEPAAPAPAAETEDDDEDSNTLSVIALIVGAGGLLTGLAALAASRRRPATT
jgi:uncharacterized protein